jgi:polyisoprenoid-binding protein YceI
LTYISPKIIKKIKMKSLKLIMPLFALAFMIACSSAPEGEKAQTGDAAEENAAEGAVYAVSEGSVMWVGSKPTGEHNGTITVSEGELVVEGDNLAGGSFTLDINTITVLDLDEDNGKSKLEGHLKSGDFFLVEEYPTAKFVITAVQAVDDREDATHNITGNLTIKDITKSISFPATVTMNEGMVSAVSPKFTIDRTEWGITYNSGVIGTAKDKLINDVIALAIDLKAAKPAM